MTYRIIRIVLGLLCVVVLALTVWIGLEGAWLALVVLLPGIVAYGWSATRAVENTKSNKQNDKVPIHKRDRASWRRRLIVRIAPDVFLPEDIPWSTAEKKIYRHYIKGLDRLKEIRLVGVSGSQPIHRVYIHVRLCNARSQRDSEIKELNLYQAIEAATGPILIVGEPGAGKSVLAQHLVNRALSPTDARLDPGLRPIGGRPAGDWIPLFVDLRRHNFRSEVKIPDRFDTWLAEQVFFGQAALDPDGAYRLNLLRKILENGRALIILDGLEMTFGEEETKVTFVVEALTDFAQRYCNSTVNSVDIVQTNLLIATARSGEADRFQDWDRFELLPLTITYQTRYTFLQNLWGDDARAAEIAQALGSHPRLNMMAGNPLLLSMFALLLQNGTASERLKRPFNRTLLYQDFVRKLWDHYHVYSDDTAVAPQLGFGNPGRAAERSSVLEFDKAKQILGTLAYNMHEQRKLAVERSKVDECARSVLGENFECFEPYWELVNRTQFLYPIDPLILERKRARWCEQLGLNLFQEVSRDPQYGLHAFLHFALQEFFVYQYLNSISSSLAIDSIYNHRMNDPWWQEVLATYVVNQPAAPEHIRQHLLRQYGKQGEFEQFALYKLLLATFKGDEIHQFCADRELFKPFVNGTSANGTSLQDARANGPLTTLRQALVAGFDEEELKTLCFDLGVKYSDLSASGRANKARELVDYLDRQDRISELIEKLEERRPELGWRNTVEWLLIEYCQQHNLLRDLLREVRLAHPQQFAQHQVYTVHLRTLFLSLRILGEYTIGFEQSLHPDTPDGQSYETTRAEIVAKILDRIETTDRAAWRKIPRADVGELLNEEEWRRVEEYSSPNQPAEIRATAALVCGKLGGEQAIELLLRCLDDSNDDGEVIQALKTLVHPATDRLTAIIRAPRSPRQRERAIEIIATSDSVQILESMLMLVEETREPSVRDQLTKAIVEIAYDPRTGAIHPRLFGYLRQPRGSAFAYQFVTEMLVEAGDRVIESLLARLCDPNQRYLHPAVVGILSRMGMAFARDSRQISVPFRAALDTLIRSNNSTEVEFALRILAGSDPDWGLNMFADLCSVPSFVNFPSLIASLENLSPMPDAERLSDFCLSALEYLSRPEHQRSRQLAQRALERLQGPVRLGQC
jgi:hypothetical protein